MKINRLYIILAIVTTWAFCSCDKEDSARETIKFNQGWRFHLGDVKDGEMGDTYDGDWRELNLPHDWAIEGNFNENNPSGVKGGALPGGIGWYRKVFSVTAEDMKKHVYITFDGVHRNATIYLNGFKVAHRPNGFVSFQYELTPWLHEGKNLIAVKVDNSEEPNSTGYSGCGIYRNVWLVKTSDLHIDNWGTFVTTPLVNNVKASVKLETTIVNSLGYNTDIEVVSTIRDQRGHEISTADEFFSVRGAGKTQIEQYFKIDNPMIWSIESPNLYNITTNIYVSKKLVDTYSTRFGIRTFYFDAEQGFILNDKNIKINGVCLYQDLGCLGVAINKRAIERQLETLKEMGCNAIRCVKNPPAPEMLELCDSMGFIVMDEAFDMWRRKKVDSDYSRYFKEWHERDLSDIILRDRNHPSVLIWSIGNEVPEQTNDQNADTLKIDEALVILKAKRKDIDENVVLSTFNTQICRKLCSIVKKLDPTRPVTASNDVASAENNLFKAGTLDIIGYNYHDDDIKDIPERFPHKPFILTESVSALMTRGYYKMPSSHEFIWPDRPNRPFYEHSMSCSSYDNCHTPWGNTHENTLKEIKKNQYVCGQFIKSGYDHLGDPTPYVWPARSSFSGIIDLAGFPKDIYYLYQSEWTNKPMLHLFPHWNWKDGEEVDVWCYYNQADEVELYLNGESVGIQRKDTATLHAQWTLNFKHGDIRAVSRKNGKNVKEQVIHTAGRPAQIRMTADRNRIHADGEDLSFITVEVLDKHGYLCPTAENDIQFEIEGTGFIAGVDNGSPISQERFKDSHRRTFYGKCLIVVQNNGKTGNIRIRATSNGLSGTEIEVHCLPAAQY